MATKMAFEGKLYYGVAGSEASTPITNRRGVMHNIDPQKAETTVTGDGSAPPITTERVVQIGIKIEWTMLNVHDDSTLAALRAAVAAGNDVALRMKDYTSGKGFNGDVTLAQDEGVPWQGEQTFKFTATPTNEGGREPQPYV